MILFYFYLHHLEKMETCKVWKWYCNTSDAEVIPDPTTKPKPRKWHVVQWVSSLSQ
ncbi:uncharacterized protein LACBIDRAFT_313753 [Laccaria bicolor S238N-H82]|uniref:Predicted protein n=1 Tax=Laccaria bicolor (strain S238N-H82 / ATCC MYA-4686) TaxID=486041 RepID=B0D0R7_LACBS|nr:uncharacterized protein LACBIDRAFT_313753 [Laccaria bicolor S238N-H82]EDR11867.1 predicted protein [Laccaria bicolor S238N-H82]|eukprot:XP_001877764.1 predicted protein [Laccaria bicolor S238N-H82]